MTSDADNTRLIVDATVERQVAYRPWWDGLAVRYEKFLGLLPGHRDTKKGRANAKQVRVALLAVGIGLIAFVGGYWIALGCLVAASALIIPVSKDTRRAWIASSRSARKNKTRPQQTPAEIVFDGRRVVLKLEGKNARRVLTDKGNHRIVRRDLDGKLAVGILPGSQKKSESIWVVAQGRTAEGEEPLNTQDVDLVARADSNEVDALLHMIEAAR